MIETIEGFTKYEVARIIGARALQIAMDAPLLIKLSDADLKAIRYDALKIAEIELKEGALPITIHRPNPKRGRDKLAAVKEELVSDEELEAKEHEVEKEIVEEAEQLGFVQEDEAEDEVVPGAAGGESTEEQ
jgi:DNA-directed RNA polymerase subunit K